MLRGLLRLRLRTSRPTTTCVARGLFAPRPFSSTSPSSSSPSTASCVNLEVTSDGIALVRLDDPNSKVNTLNEKLNKDFEAVLNKVESDPNIKAVVLISSKKDNFIAGADIGMLSAHSDSAQALQKLSSDGQKLLHRLATGKPKIAAINGSCMGGGLEVALACHYRIATESPKTTLALPEVKLGLLPGAGGTQRLPRLIDIPTALDMLLTGKTIYPKKAKKMNLIDQVTDPNALEAAALQAARNIVSQTLKINRKEGLITRWTRSAIMSLPFARNLVFNKAKSAVLKETGGKYPAPLAILEVVKTGLEKGVEAGLKLEAEKFGQLGTTQESKSLVHIFNGSNQLKKNRFGNPEKRVQTIAVLGAGLMGAGITSVSIDKGYRVILKDLNHEGLGRGQKQVYKNLDDKVRKKQMTSFERDTILSRVIPLTEDPTYGDWTKHFKKVDLVVEAVFENLDLKHRVIKATEEHLPEHAVFATNTSALPIVEIAKASKRPQNIIGMHYFSPVEKMPLLEIITTPQTSKETAAKAVDVGLKQGKFVIVVKDVPGFYVNRSLGPYMDETSALLRDGVEPQALDKAIREFGLPVGPISLADEVGIDVGYHVQEYLAKHLGARMKGGDVSAMKEMVDKKILGRKSGKGFYLYQDAKKKGPKEINPEVKEILDRLRGGKEPKKLSTQDIQDRMMLRFINEAVYCLQDEIIATPVDGDMGLIFGVGFPPFLGGPFRYIDTVGASTIVKKMERLRDTYGEHFTPAPLLQEVAKSGKKFHSS